MICQCVPLTTALWCSFGMTAVIFLLSICPTVKLGIAKTNRRTMLDKTSNFQNQIPNHPILIGGYITVGQAGQSQHSNGTEIRKCAVTTSILSVTRKIWWRKCLGANPKYVWKPELCQQYLVTKRTIQSIWMAKWCHRNPQLHHHGVIGDINTY